MIKNIKMLFLIFILTSSTSLLSMSLSKEELSQLSNQEFTVRHFFFYSTKIQKAFLFTKGSNNQEYSLYYFRPDGLWEPVSNAPAFRSLPEAKQQFSNISFSPATNTVSFGEFMGDTNTSPNYKNTQIIKDKKRSMAILSTTLGDITIELYDDIAPLTVENFIYLSKNNKYNDLIFHRIIKNFMVQGGDPKGDGTGGMSKWGERFKDEFHDESKFDEPYLLAMANSGPNTNGSQFFITLVKTPWLNDKHTIFGKVTKGQNIVDNMGSVSVDKNSKPLEDIKIIKIKIIDPS